MVKVTAEMFGPFDRLAGTKTAELELSNATVRGLLAEMQSHFGNRFMEAILDAETGEFSISVLVLVNNTPVYHLQGLDTELKSGDKVIFITPMAGGQARPLPGTNYTVKEAY